MIRHRICAIGLIGSLLFFSKNANTQNLYFNSPDEIKFIDRLHTLYGHNGDTFLVNTPGASMSDAYNLYNFYKTDIYNGVLSNSDIYKLNQYLIYNSDMSSSVADPLISVPQYTGTAGLYRNTPFLLEKKGNFNFLLQPVFAQTALYDFNNTGSGFYNQTYAGIYTRMSVGSRLGIQARVLYRNENLLDHFLHYADEFNAVPGYLLTNGYKPQLIGQNMGITDIMPTGQIVYDVVPSRLTISAGFDQLFVGEGIRTLILGNSNAPLPFVVLKTKVWKLDYTNIFIKPRSQNIYTQDLPGAGQEKYVFMHYLSANIGKRFNVGVFETVTSTREGAPDASYFNPIIFYRAIERHLGSPDKMALGMTGSAVITKGLKAYGQIFINEFIAKELLARDGFIHNKWGVQLGLKYYDVGNIDNLDMQFEMNMVRPYSYQHRTNSNFSNNNLPLAHPLGADFKEYMLHLSYKPHTKVQVQGRLHHYIQGKDMNGLNYGSNMLKDIRTHHSRYGVRMIHGRQLTVTSADFSVRYEFLPHLYFEIGSMYRQEQFIDSDKQKRLFGFASVQFHLNKRDLMIF